MIGVNDLERKWREEAHEAVPEEYTCRGLDEKYLRGDNSAAGLNDAADYLEDAAQEAWHPVSDPPSAEKDGDHDGMVMIWAPFAGLGMTHPNRMGRMPEGAKWARIRDVVLMPPQSTTGEN